MPRILTASVLAVLVLGAGFWYFIVRPVELTEKGLRLAAAVRVGQTSEDDFRKMAIRDGLRPVESTNDFGLEQRNRLLENLRLSPQTVVRISVRLAGGLVTGVSVRAWIGQDGQVANIEINEFDSHNTGCGDVPVCIKPTSSTMLTSVFFVPDTPINKRERLLSLDSWCLAKFRGCNSREFFPAAWEREQP
jgi:hypothetical protein